MRPPGTVDVLIGYNYAAYHPQKEQSTNNLLLLNNRSRSCIGGTHPSIKEKSVKHDLCNEVNVEDFYNIENFGIQHTPRCGECKCGKYSLGSKDYTIKEKELALIEKNLKNDMQDERWIAEYPWIKYPTNLSDNRIGTYAN